MSEEILGFFKALADANRLKIVGLLAQQTYSVEQLAAMLHLRASTVSHHLSKLAEVDLVSARAEGYYNVYQLEEATLQKTRLLFSKQDLATVVEGVDMDAYERKVLEDYSEPDGRLKTIPTQGKKLEAVLRGVINVFDANVRYTEKQVNEMLVHFHEDVATLRRELIAFGLLEREVGGESYSRVDKR